TLQALHGVASRLLEGALADADALYTHGHARMIHHREHEADAVVGLAHQVADGAAVVAVAEYAGGTGVDAELVFQRYHLDVIAGPRTVPVREVLGHEKQ